MAMEDPRVFEFLRSHPETFGEPKRAHWYARGREATRAEVMASIDSGLPILRDMAESEGPAAVAELERMHQQALACIPAGAS